MVIVVSDIEVAGTIERHTSGPIEPSSSTDAISGSYHARRAGQRGHRTRAKHHLPNRVVIVVSDVEVAGAVGHHALGPKEPSGRTDIISAAWTPNPPREKAQRGQFSVVRDFTEARLRVADLPLGAAIGGFHAVERIWSLERSPEGIAAGQPQEKKT